MKKRLGSIAAALVVLASAATLLATPSTEFWTSGTSDIQPFGVGHLGIDNYFHIAGNSAEANQAMPTDVGYTVGILPFSKLQAEVGIDVMGASSYPIMFNVKLGVPEGSFFKLQPGIAVGLFNVGTKKDYTDYNIAYAALGKTLPFVGRLFIGGYTGNKTTLAGTDDNGFTIAWDRAFCPAKSASGADFNRITVCADWASGKNYYGGGGFGLAYYFTESISLLAGPTFFNDEGLNGKWKLSTQLDVNFKTW